MMRINVTVTPKNLLIWGATYGISEQIKALGGIWSPTEGIWKLPPILDPNAIYIQLNSDLTVAKANAIALALSHLCKFSGGKN